MKSCFAKKALIRKVIIRFYEELLGKKLKEVIQEEQAPILRLIDKEKILRFIASVKDYGKPWYGQLMAGPQMLAYLWQINEWMNMYQL